uniref:Protein MON2 homolog n=1 Tax=Plectus sambesii TaxID=2011161 RepID=A0A914UNH9_9BILA
MSEAKKLVESLQTDLRSLSNEAKKKHNSVKDASEAAMVKVRNITDGATESNLISRLRQASNELLHPFVMGCASKNPRLVQISLAGVQRLVQHRAVETNVVPAIVQELWSLMEAECEELRVLQTLSLIVSTDHLVSGPSLAKCLVMCFRLNFAKDPIVINTASASVRQLIDLVFERIVKEDGLNANGNGQSQTQPEAAKTSAPPRLPPATLKPAAADGYMLFRDLCLLLNAEQPSWLIGIQEMTRTLGLELLESVLSGYPSIFANHQEFVFLLKEQVCPLVIKLFSPNLKYLQVASQHPHSRQTADAPSSDRQQDRPYFPIAMRLLRVVCVLITRFYDLLVTECEIFLTLILKFMESDKLPWQRGLALETLHRITAKPDLLRSFCISYDLKPHSAKVLQSIVSGLAGFVQASFLKPESHNQSSKEEDGSDGNGQAIGQPGFLYRGIWIPLCFISAQGSPKTLLLELLDKHEPPLLSDGYCLSLAYGGMVDACQSLYQAIENEGAAAYKSELSQALFNSSHSSILATLSLLLDASIDESITETLLKCLSTLVGLSCRLEQPGARDATLGALCKASLPPNYLVRVLGAHSGSSPVDSPRSGKIDAFESDATAGHPNQVVAVGTACPTPALSSQLLSAPVMLTSKNLQSTRSLIATAQINGPQLNESWHLVLASVQHLVWILGMKPSPSGGFRTGGESGDATTVLTTAVMADVPVMASMLNKLFDMTAELDDVGLHHVIAALCKLSSESMRVAQNQREPSFFPVAKLLQTGWANLKRLPVFWKPLTAHLIEVSSVSFAKLREWGATALTMLVRQALVENIDLDEVKRQQMVLAPLLDVCEIEFADVRQKQIDCLMQIIQSRGQQLKPELWPTVITIVGSVVSGQFSFDEALIKQSYQAVNLMVTDFLETLSLRCVQMLVETDAKFGVQQKELNISLSAVGQLVSLLYIDD